MGRIIVFTSDDIHSKYVILMLRKRSLPFTEISLAAHPSRRADLAALAQSISVPQVFFNTRHIGGMEATLKELAGWDKDVRFDCPLARYKYEIESMPDPGNKRLQAPTITVESPISAVKRNVFLQNRKTRVQLPDATQTSVLDMTEKLKNSLPREEHKYKDALYVNCFTGKQAVDEFQKHLEISEDEAITFGKYLQKAGLFDHVNPGDVKNSIFQNSSKEVYRLQCYKESDVLNSYRLWNEVVNPNYIGIVQRLDKLLTTIELNCVNDNGQTDYARVLHSMTLTSFEDAVCEVQKIDMVALSQVEIKVMGINLYRLMLRYAFIKIGMPKSETDRLSFLKSIKFNVGGLLFSFQEWVDGVLRGNKKSLNSSKIPFTRLDARQKFALSDLDFRVHFALNVSAELGSSSSLPFSQFTVEHINEELNIAAQVFCNENVEIDIAEKTVYLSKVFRWYRSDFASTDAEILGKIQDFLLGYNALNMKRLLQVTNTPKIIFKEMEWGRYACNCPPYHKDVVRASDKKGIIAQVVRRFQPPKNPENERTRLETLRSLNLLDTLHEERFDRITRMVKETFDVPVVLVALMDEDRNVMKSTQWAFPMDPPKESPREISFCGHAINNEPNDVFIVPNALEDDRFAENPLVTSPFAVRFYAGYVIRIPSSDGGPPVNVGTLCVFDQKPRDFTDAQLEQFRLYGAMVKKEILRRESIGVQQKPPSLIGASCLKMFHEQGIVEDSQYFL